MSRGGRIALTVAVTVAAVGFAVLRSGSDDSGGGKSPTATGGGAAASAPPVRRIELRGGKPVGGVQKIAVTKGGSVRLVVSSPDSSSEVHVHGYDLRRDLAPGRPASFRFTADIEGAFEVELEDTATKIASLEVRPG